MSWGSVMDNEYESDIFEVDRILDDTMKTDGYYYKVRWQGYGSEEDTWEPAENLMTCQDIVHHYWEEKHENQSKDSGHQNVNNEDGSDFESSSVDLDPPPEKRKRGRPPKKNMFLNAECKREHSLAEEQKENNSYTSEDEEIPTIVKRRPGRPKKSKVHKGIANDLDSSLDREKNPSSEKSQRGRQPKKKSAANDRKHEFSFSPLEANYSSEEEDIPQKLRRPGRPRKTDSELDKELTLSSPELTFLYDLEDIAPRGMTRQASKELALVQMRRNLSSTSVTQDEMKSKFSQFVYSEEVEVDQSLRQQTETTTCSGVSILNGDGLTSRERNEASELSSQSTDIIEISSQSTDDNEARNDYIVISSQSESEHEETGQRSKVKKRRDVGESMGLGSSEDDEKEFGNESLGCNERYLRTNEGEPQVIRDARKKTSEISNEGSIFRQLSTDEEDEKRTDKTNAERYARTGDDFPGSRARFKEYKTRDGLCDSSGYNSSGSKLSLSTKDDSRLSKIVDAKEGSDSSTVVQESREVSSSETRDENSNKIKISKLSKLFSDARSKNKAGNSKDGSRVGISTESSKNSRGPRSRCPSISEKPDDVSRGSRSGEKPAQGRGLFDILHKIRGGKTVRDVENFGGSANSATEEAVRDKTSICKDVQSLNACSDKKDTEKRLNAAKATRKSRFSKEDSEIGNKGDNVASSHSHSHSNGSSLLATALNISETNEERSRTWARARKSSKSQSAGPLMEGDLLGSIIRGSIQSDGKIKTSQEKLSENTESNKSETRVEGNLSLESMVEDISDGELDTSECEFDLDDFSPETFYENLEVKPRPISPSSPIVTPLEVPFGTLKQAIKKGDEITLRSALAAGCDVHKVDGASGMTLLMWAAAAGQDNVVRLLLRNGAKVDVSQKNGTTALMHASEQGFAETVEILLCSGAHINSQQMTGETALMKAAKKGHADVVDILLRKAADTRVQSNFDHSALQLALMSQHFEVHGMISEHEKRLTSILEVALGKCLGQAGNLRTPPLMPFRCVAPGEAEKVRLQFKYLPSRFPQGADVVLFCVLADFYSEDVCTSFSGDNGVRSIVLNGKVQLPVLQGNRSVYVLKPVPMDNELCVHTHRTSCRLIVCIYPVSG